MALTMWGQLIIQSATPGEDPVKIGTQWVDISGTPTLKLCTAISPYTFAAISGGTSDHNHTSTASDGGVLTNDEHDGYLDVAASSTPSTPSAGHARLYAQTNQGHTIFRTMDEDGIVYRMGRDAVLLVRNTSGSDITKGQTCDIYSATGAIPEIRLADADTTPPRHCEGFAFENIANNAYGMILLSGEITGLDTSSFAEGAEIYQSTTAGAYTATAPTDGSLVQSLGIITRSHATQGSIEAIIALPLLHATVHQSGGKDAIQLDNLAAPDDNTDLDASATKHGLMPKWTAAFVSGLIDLLTGATTRGAILYRNATVWVALSPGTATHVLTSNGAGADPSYQAAAGGGGMQEIIFTAMANVPPTSAFATLDMRNNHPVLDFDTTTAESAVFGAVLPSTYAGGGLSVDIYWTGATATSGDVVWDVAIEAMSGLDLDADSFATAQTATGTANGTSGIYTKTTVTFTDGAQMDSLAASGAFRLKLTRDTADGADTMTGDAEVHRVVVRET